MIQKKLDFNINNFIDNIVSGMDNQWRMFDIPYHGFDSETKISFINWFKPEIYGLLSRIEPQELKFASEWILEHGKIEDND